MKPFSVITWRLVFIFFFLTSLSASPAQHVSAIQPNPFLVADLNTTPQHSYPYPFMPDGAVSYFFTYNYGQQLWIDKAPRLYQTDGTQAGTHIVKSIGPGDDSADTPQSMKYAKFGDYLFFSAYNGDHQAYEVWRTDGTTENTIAVPISSTDGGSLASFLLFDSKLYIGLPKGIWYLEDPLGAPQPLITSISNNSVYPNLQALGNRILFAWSDAQYGAELWESDGTSEGTHRLFDLFAGVNSSWSKPLMVYQDTLYFTANVGAGSSFYAYQAGQALPVRLLQANWFSGPMPMDGQVFLIANDAAGSALYRIDGQNAQKVSLFPDADTPRYLLGTFHQAGSTRLVLTASDNGLYISDGTPAGSVKLAGLRSLGDPTMTAINGMFLFSADDGQHGTELWESDGTPEGTRILKDIKPGLDSGYPMVFGHCGDRVCFFADDGVHGIEPWSSDGTSEGTQMLIDANNIPASSNPGHLVASDGKVYFTATNDGTTYNLYRTSLGVAGTELLKSNLGSISYSPDDQVLAVDDGQVYFMEAMNGNHLWWTPPDGQPVLLKDIPSLMDNPQVEFMQVLNHRLYFAYGNQLWTASGTASEAHILYSLAYPIKFMTTFQGKLLFDQSRPGSAGWYTNLYLSDGVAPATQVPGTFTGSVINSAGAGNQLYLSVMSGSGAYSLLQLDGTSLSTSWVTAPTCLGSYGSLRRLTAVGDSLYFVDQSSDNTRMTLLKTRGAEAVVECLWSANLPANTWLSNRPLTQFQSRVFFEVPTGNAIDGTLQVMMTDGTSAGTMLMPGLSQDASGMQVTNNPVAAPNGIYFQARTILHGSELWFWDGAAPEPRLVNDLRPGPDSSAPAPLAIVDGWIYYNANDGQSGRELWALDTTNLPTVQSEIVTDRSAGVAPLTVKFSTAPSMAAISFAWDFGDGSTSTEAKPTHIFATPGQYTVQLVFSDDYGQQTLTHIITVYAPVKAAFTVRPDQGNAPLTVHFTGQASGDFTSLEWDFGDGVTSSEPNPSHTYSISGVYTVRLTVNGPGGQAESSAVITVSNFEWHTYLPIIIYESSVD